MRSWNWPLILGSLSTCYCSCGPLRQIGDEAIGFLGLRDVGSSNFGFGVLGIDGLRIEGLGMRCFRDGGFRAWGLGRISTFNGVGFGTYSRVLGIAEWSTGTGLYKDCYRDAIPI